MSNNIYKKQDIYLFKSYTSVSLKVWQKPKYNF